MPKGRGEHMGPTLSVQHARILMVAVRTFLVVGLVSAIAGMVATVISNTLVSSIFGAAAFAQTAMGRMFQAGQTNALDFYNQVYNGALFGTALIALLLFMIGGIFIGNAITASRVFPRWTGWVYALTIVGFVLSNFLFEPGKSISSILLFIATIRVPWGAGKEPQS